MATPETRRQLLAAVQAAEDKKGVDTRILELDPADSGLADFFLITSATNDRQVVAIADEIEFRLKKDFGLYASSVEGRRQAEWILLDYVDIVIHVFLEEKRAFYDIERLRKSARNLTSAELEAELRTALVEKTRAVRESRPAAKSAAKKAAASKSPASKAVAAKGDASVSAKPAKKAAKKAAKPVAEKAATKASFKPIKGDATKPAASKKAALKSSAVPKTPPLTHLIKRTATPVKDTVLAPSTEVRGFKPPILKCEDPETLAQVGVMADHAGGAKPPIVKCEDPEGNTVAISASIEKAAKNAPIKAAAKKAPSTKAAAKPALKSAAKPALKSAAKKAAAKTKK